MFGGESVDCAFRTSEKNMQQVTDWFGKKIKAKREGESVIVRVKVNERAMFHWALQYGPDVTVLEPLSLVESLRGAIDDLQHRYQQEES